MKIKRVKVLGVMLLMLPVCAMAHAGHAHEEGLWQNIIHAVVTAVPFLIVTAVVIALGFFSNKRSKKRKYSLDKK